MNLPIDECGCSLSGTVFLKKRKRKRKRVKKGRRKNDKTRKKNENSRNSEAVTKLPFHGKEREKNRVGGKSVQKDRMSGSDP